jgi:hypothetical protein
MGDPQSWWLNLTNVALGAGVLLVALLVLAGAAFEAFKHHHRAGSHTS